MFFLTFEIFKHQKAVEAYEDFQDSLNRLEFFVVEYRFESIQIPSSPRGGHEETI